VSVSTKSGMPSLAEQMATRSLVLMPINDKTDPDEHEGGGHWSLLVFRRAADGAAGKFEHYDSCKGGNAVHARAVARCLVTNCCSREWAGRLCSWWRCRRHSPGAGARNACHEPATARRRDYLLHVAWRRG